MAQAERPAVAAVIDARGLACPLPLVKLRQAFMVVDGGARVCLLATDPATPADVAEFCEVAGHEIVEQEVTAALITLVVQKRG
jgi:tRNA 2-thiouridine synthesizing protein A